MARWGHAAKTGSPKLMRPFVRPAREVAERRNWLREMRGRNGTLQAAGSCRKDGPRPRRGRCRQQFRARRALRVAFVKATGKQEVSGIPVAAWLTFFRHFSDTRGDLDAVVEVIEKRLGRTYPGGEAREGRMLAEYADHLHAALLGTGSGA